MELEDDSIDDQPTSPHYQCHDSVTRTIRGMESVVATVSGYHGSERFNLIKLISQAGANYVGVMSRSITHLVCWKFEGKKFNLAKKFKILIVSHQWFEDCVKAGRRIPEDPYILQSGQGVGPLRLDGLLVAKKAGPLTEKPHKVFLDLSNVGDDSEDPIINPKGGGSSHCVWSDSCLLNEVNLFPNNSFKSNRKAGKKPLEEEQSSTIRYCQEPSLSVSVRMKGESSSCYATRSVRRKKDICNAVESTISAETSRKGRRLVKRNISRDILVQVLSDSEQVFDSAGTRNPHANIRPPSNCPVGGTNETLLIYCGDSDGELEDPGRNRIDSLEAIFEIKDLNQTSSSGGLNLCSDDVSAVVEGISEDGCPYAKESLCEELKIDDQNERITRLPTSTELSCVICHTDFSSTRGVLPCGHRFCYPCIQKWADHMASMRKISTCPLCKASFASITKFDTADTSDQKIYSQTIPYAASTTDIFPLPDRETFRIGPQFTVAPVCSGCQHREPEDLLISCHVCRNRCIHSYCLDPPLLPWTCIHCKDLRMHYLYNR